MDPALAARLEACRLPDEVISSFRSKDWETGILEPRRGYRFRPENLSLPEVLARRDIRARRVLDLGAGSGSLILAADHALSPERSVAVEIQEDMADRATRTISCHALDVVVIAGDLRSAEVQDRTRAALGGGADLIVTNPPFFPPEWGRPSARESTRRSTHAEDGGVRDFLRVAADLLAPEGRIFLLFDAARLAEALAVSTACGLGLLHLDLALDGDRPYRAWIGLGRGANVGLIGPVSG